MKSTPETRELEEQFKILYQYGTRYGWTYENYREYINIRQELKEKCKENYHIKWEEEMKTIVDNSRDSKIFLEQD